jgi:hypothetical protein
MVAYMGIVLSLTVTVLYTIRGGKALAEKKRTGHTELQA